MKERLVRRPPRSVNLLPLKEEMAGIGADDDGSIRIGALATLTQLEQHPAMNDPALRGPARIGRGLRDAARAPSREVAGNILQFTRCWYVRSEAHRCLHGRRGPVSFPFAKAGVAAASACNSPRRRWRFASPRLGTTWRRRRLAIS